MFPIRSNRRSKTAIRLNNLAALLQATGRLVEAESLARRAVAMIVGSLGWAHPTTHLVAANCHDILQQAGWTEDRIRMEFRLPTEQVMPSVCNTAVAPHENRLLVAAAEGGSAGPPMPSGGSG